MAQQQLVDIIVEEILRAGLSAGGGDSRPVGEAARAADVQRIAVPARAAESPGAGQAEALQEASPGPGIPVPGEQSGGREPAAAQSDAMRRMRETTPARIGVGRCGARLRTQTMLAFRVDHAAARDSVRREVSPELLQRLNLFSVSTRCRDRNEYLTRPDLGREFDEQALEAIKSRCAGRPRVQLFAAGGLSAEAVEANLANTRPACADGLAAKGIAMGTPFYVEFARVGCMDAISEALDAEVTCVLIGERPGLATAESMSAYIAYRATAGMPESRRTVVSNIHKGGIAAVEAGAYIADVICRILEQKASGVELKR